MRGCPRLCRGHVWGARRSVVQRRARAACFASLRRSGRKRPDFAALLGLRSCRRTRFVRCAHYAQTTATSQITKRAARADRIPALLAAAAGAAHATRARRCRAPPRVGGDRRFAGIEPANRRARKARDFGDVRARCLHRCPTRRSQAGTTIDASRPNSFHGRSASANSSSPPTTGTASSKTSAVARNAGLGLPPPSQPPIVPTW